MKRREFSPRVRAEIVNRAMNDRGLPVCEGCGGVLKRKEWEIDHTTAEGLVIDKSRPLTAEDGKLLGYCCHRGEDGKTANDVRIIAKAKRQQRGHLGTKVKRSRFQTSRDGPFKGKIGGGVERR